MGSSNHSQELKLSKFETPQALKTTMFGFLFIGFVTFILGFIKNPERLWTSYLTAFFYFACLAVGAMFFIAFNHTAKAGWSSSIRRLVESFTSYLPVMLVTSFILLLGFKKLYQWDDAGLRSEMGSGRWVYLNPAFVTARLIIFGLGDRKSVV